MNENLDLTKILKDCPKGTKLYSPIYGYVTLDGIIETCDDYPIMVHIKNDDDDYNSFTKDGRLYKAYDAECMLFPSKDNRDWSTFKVSSIVPNKLPKTWEEFCILNNDTTNDYYIDYTCSLIVNNGLFSNNRHTRDISKDKCLLPNKETAQAMLALCQLVQLRDCYNEGWQPDWSENEYKYCIEVENYEIVFDNWCHLQRVLTFKTKELRDTFLNNFKDLIEIAKPLL